MDIWNVNVRVLYDFEYVTKYGRNINITSGERLLLIKKTNNDWWQVIRSSDQRPFYVPASYVEEIEAQQCAANKDQSITKCFSSEIAEKDPLSNVMPNKNLTDLSSTAHIKLVENNKTNSNELSNKQDVIDSKVKTETVSNTMPSSGYNSFCEEISIFEEEDMPYSALNDTDINSQHKNNNSLLIESKIHSESSADLDNIHGDAIVNPPATDKELSENRDSSFSKCIGKEDKLHKCNTHCKYLSDFSSKSCNSELDSLRNIPDLPATDSLENLYLQIELKTSSLRNTTDSKDKYSGVYMNKDDRSNNILQEDISNQGKCLSADNCSIGPKGKIQKTSIEKLHNMVQIKCKESRSSESVCENNRSTEDYNSLKYHGSFKTNTEKQRWFKKCSSERQLGNVFKCSDDLSDKTTNLHKENFINQVDTSKSIANTRCDGNRCTVADTNNVHTSKKTDEILQKSNNEDKLSHKKYLGFGSEGQLFHLKTGKEQAASHHSLDSVVEDELRESNQGREHSKFKRKEYFATTQPHSGKSSIDSLIDLENDGDFRKISGGTTSDSLVPTDGEDLLSSESDEKDSVKYARHKEEDFKYAENNTRIIPIRRHRGVSTSKPIYLSQDPPSPTPNQSPTRTLHEGWNEYHTQDRRRYFYNVTTKEKRWKPPRRNHNTNVESYDEHDSNEAGHTDDMFVVNLPLPSGWCSKLDIVSGQTCYINIGSGSKWFSSTDSEGRVYFFEENSNKSSWTLPDNHSIDNNENRVSDSEKTNFPTNIAGREKSLNRNVKSRSMILSARYEESNSLSNVPQNWPQLWEGTMCVLKEGPLNKTKITENGKRIRKNWTSTHAVLTELLLLFFKDNKGFPSMQMGGSGRPELSVDLNGALIDPGDKVSSRKNVYMLSTVLGLQVLIQCDCCTTAEQWLQAIQAAINSLPSSNNAKFARSKTESSTEEGKVNTRIGRSKSMKLKQKSTSIEDMSVNVAERQTRIKERLKKFFHKRPSVDLLVKKGIWKDEPVFGCLLEQACSVDPPRVPLFVQHCIHCIERSEENLKSDGLYRASGNLSQVQKIRLQVDQNVYSLLEQEEDVHVLAGCLKLFFRELKQPLIPFKFFNKALSASTNPNHGEKIKDFREIVKSLPACNYDTLKLLLQHLLSVTQYHEFNRMHIPNIAIVFGPTLMWPEQESLNMAFDLMQQNLVIECFLSHFKPIFE